MNWRNQTRKHEPVAYFIVLALMAIGLTLSPFMMGISQILLAMVWLFMGDPVNVKLKRFFHNRTALILVSLYLLLLVGLIWTSDYQYALKDLRIKLPMLVTPLVLSSVKPLEKKHFDLLLLLYVMAVFVATCISFYIYRQHEYNDIREISIFISHIRFCLNIVFVIGITMYYLFTRTKAWWERMLQVVLIAWFCYQLYIFESLSGYVAFAGMVAVSLLYLFFNKVKHLGWRIACVAVIIALPTIAGIYLHRMIAPMLQDPIVDFDKLDKKTALGNDYWHDTVCFPIENGKYVGLYFCRPEMREAWNNRSELDYDGQTLNGENLEATLARFLTSKELRKDASGVNALTDQDIHLVEQGVANYINWTRPGIYSRIAETIFEYRQYRNINNPNGGSLSQRIEYTKASFHLIKKHPVLGVGTGDVPNAYQQAYDELNSPLEQQFRHRAHNQYLSITVGLGIIGLIVFMVSLLYPYCIKRNRNYLYTIFFVILLISMLPEDTLETQAGVTFYALFNSLLIFAFGKGDETQKTIA